MEYYFKLGHQPHISIAELATMFAHQKIKYNTVRQTKEYWIIDSTSEIDTETLINQLGGTVYIGTKIPYVNDTKNSILQFLLENTQGKIHFSLSGATQKMALEIKKELKKEGKSVRYVEAKNTATILHNNLVDKKSHFTIAENSIFMTSAIQDIEEFSKRDYERPGSDSTSGMLPPKLARIMINLAQINHDDTLLDPFCGSGTILTEALSLGYTQLIGSDLSQKAVDDTRKNVEWTISQSSNTTTQRDNNISIHLSDATKLASIVKPNSIFAIASEPYMGKPLRGSETKDQLHLQTRELAQLYTESFEQFHTILKKDAVVIFIIPQFKYTSPKKPGTTQNNIGQWITIDCITEIEQIGFEVVPFDPTHKSLLYHRPKQFLGREIWKFRKI